MRIVFERVNSGQFILVYKIMSKRHVSSYFLFSNASIHVRHEEKSESLPPVWLIALKKLPTSFGIAKAVFTLYKIAFASA